MHIYITEAHLNEWGPSGVEWWGVIGAQSKEVGGCSKLEMLASDQRGEIFRLQEMQEMETSVRTQYFGWDTSAILYNPKQSL